MNTILDIIHHASWIELIISIYSVCLILLIVNMRRMENGVRCLISLSVLTFFLIGGLVWLEEKHDTANFFLYWAIGGAIGQFTFAGAVLLGLFGGLAGIIVTLLLGFVLCPLLWLRLVFSILCLSLVETPKRSIAIILCMVGGCLYVSSPVTILDSTIVQQITNRNVWDINIFPENRTTRYIIIHEIEQVLQKAQRDKKSVCYAITVEGSQLPPSLDTDHPWEWGGSRLVKQGEQTLILNVPYKATDLSACCGTFDTDVTGTQPLFLLKCGTNGQDCLLSELNPSQMRVVTNKLRTCTSTDLKAYHDSHGKLPDYPLTYRLEPGMTISLVPTALGSSSLSDESTLREQVRCLRIKEIHYLDAEGNSHSVSASPIRKAIESFMK